jgi:hypothetical protein
VLRVDRGDSLGREFDNAAEGLDDNVLALVLHEALDLAAVLHVDDVGVRGARTRVADEENDECPAHGSAFRSAWSVQ